MSRTSSNTSLRSGVSFSRLSLNPRSSNRKQSATNKIDEKGDADPNPQPQPRNMGLNQHLFRKDDPSARRQRSDPVLSSATISRESVVGSRPSSAKKSASVESSISAGRKSSSEKRPRTPEEEVICEVFKTDPQLRSLCTSMGIGLHPDTLVGPIEKGQLIIGVLHDSLNDLIKLKTRKAVRKGESFHIQRSGLDTAIRALANAGRSLKTMKESKEPMLGPRARSQQSMEWMTQQQRQARLQQKQTESVIRILSKTKEKFDKMGSGLGRFMTGAILSDTSFTVPSTVSTTASSSRRTSRSSLATSVYPLSSGGNSSRARSSISSISTGSQLEDRRRMSAV